MIAFDQLGLAPELLRAIEPLGFKKPTEVQATVIPEVLNGDRDLVALAQTGTGKTAAFGLPLLQRLTPGNRHIQALILCPTRELCLQITRDLNLFAATLPAVRIVPVYGGADIRVQMTELRRGAQIVVGTPGRMVDLLRRRAIGLDQARCIVLDEADEMLKMGFEEDLEAILAALPAERRTLLFSATMPRSVNAIRRSFMTKPLEITIGLRNAGADNVVHEYYLVHAKDRYAALRRIIDLLPAFYGIIFCRTRQETQEIADWLARDGYPAQALHGDLSQPQRDRVMKGFRERRYDLLVATDVAARGLDVRNLTHIVNYSLPEDPDAYTHRSGRTGRAGETGTSIVLLNLREQSRLHRIEQQLGRSFIARPVPSGDDVCRVRIKAWLKRWQALEPDSPLLDELLPSLTESLAELSREELLRKVVFLELQRLLEYYRDQPDLNPAPRAQGRKSATGSDGAAAAVELNIGAGNGLNPKKLLRLFETACGRRPEGLGRITIASRRTQVAVPAAQAAQLVAQLNAGELLLGGRRVKAELAGAPLAGSPGRAPFAASKRGNQRRTPPGKRYPTTGRAQRSR